MAIDLIPLKEMWSEVAVEMETYVLDAGFKTVENFVGHGIGKNMHEPPQVPNYRSKTLRAKDDFRLEPGIVIAVEPMVNLGTKRVIAEPDHWTMFDRRWKTECPLRTYAGNHRRGGADTYRSPDRSGGVGDAFARS